MAGFSIDLSNVQEFTSLSSFPDGAYAARIIKADLGLSRKGDPQLELEFEIFSESLGTGKIKQNITSNMGFMMLPFWRAVNDLTPEEIAENPHAKIDDPDKFVDEELIVFIGDKKSNTLDENGNPKVYKNVVSPFFAALTQYQELADDGLIR